MPTIKYRVSYAQWRIEEVSISRERQITKHGRSVDYCETWAEAWACLIDRAEQSVREAEAALVLARKRLDATYGLRETQKL